MSALSFNCINVKQNLDFIFFVNNIKIHESKLPHKSKIATKTNSKDLVLCLESTQNLDEKFFIDIEVSLMKSYQIMRNLVIY